MDAQIVRIPVARPRGKITELTPDLDALAAELGRRVDGEVRFDPGSRALYATDASNYRQVPHGVVIPRSLDALVEAVSVCRAHGVPLLPRGGGTSLAGQCCNVAVVLDTSKYLHGVLEIDAPGRRARVLPGTILDTLRAAAAPAQLTFGPDPATHDHCTVGGMIGNNSCGPHSVMAGRTSENVEALEVLTYDGLRLTVGATTPAQLEAIVAAGGRRGQIYQDLRALRDRYAGAIRSRFPHIPRRVSGYNLEELLPEKGFQVARLLVGSEGTLVTVLEATLRLVPWPRHRSLLVLGYPDVFHAADHVPAVLEHGPIALEGLDDRLLEFMRLRGLHQRHLHYLPEGAGFLMAEFGGEDRADADRRARAAMVALARSAQPPAMKLYDDPAQEDRLWKIRESALGATARVPGLPDTWEGWEDSAVPVERLGAYLRELRQLFDRYGFHPAVYGHFGQGCVHCRIEFDFTSEAGITRDELRGLFPDDEDARRLGEQTFTLGEWVEKCGGFGNLNDQAAGGRAILHGHCHQQALLGVEEEERVLRGTGLDVETLDAGCCGMAGAFGFEREKYEVSMRIGEQKLLPAVRAASSYTAVVADGFSCREQIRHGTRRRALHLAEVLHRQLRPQLSSPPSRLPVFPSDPPARISLLAAALVTGAIAALLGHHLLLRRS